MNLPDIHQWWPHLTIDAKHALETPSDGSVPSCVREEIRALPGTTVPEDARLSDADRDYIRTQGEAVD